MKIFIFGLVFLGLQFAAIAPAYALGLVTSSRRLTPKSFESVIFRGQSVSEADSTWKSVVQWQSSEGSCTGVFIADDVMLTAAHCVVDVPETETLKIRFFKGSEHSNVLNVRPSEYVLVQNEKYVSGASGRWNNDLAILVLYRPVAGAFNRTADFLTSKDASAAQPGSLMTMVGTGTTEMFQDNEDGNLRFSKGVLSSLEPGSVRIDGTNESALCNGDSGSPLFAQTAQGFKLVGILSASLASSAAAKCGSVAYYTFISSEHYDWIQSHIKAAREALAAR